MNIELRAVFKVKGIICGGCLNRINQKMISMGASNVDIDIALKIVKIDVIGEASKADEFCLEINKLGYEAKKLAVYNPDEVFSC